MSDMVNHPSHYTKHPSGVEAIQVTRHMNFNLGNAMKYIWRAGLKDDAIQDLEKAVFYLNDEIARLGGTPARQERERAIRLAREVTMSRDHGLVGDYLYLEDFISYMNDEENK